MLYFFFKSIMRSIWAHRRKDWWCVIIIIHSLNLPYRESLIYIPTFFSSFWRLNNYGLLGNTIWFSPKNFLMLLMTDDKEQKQANTPKPSLHYSSKKILSPSHPLLTVIIPPDHLWIVEGEQYKSNLLEDQYLYNHLTKHQLNTTTKLSGNRHLGQ